MGKIKNFNDLNKVVSGLGASNSSYYNSSLKRYLYVVMVDDPTEPKQEEIERYVESTEDLYNLYLQFQRFYTPNAFMDMVSNFQCSTSDKSAIYIDVNGLAETLEINGTVTPTTFNKYFLNPVNHLAKEAAKGILEEKGTAYLSWNKNSTAASFAEDFLKKKLNHPAAIPMYVHQFATNDDIVKNCRAFNNSDHVHFSLTQDIYDYIEKESTKVQLPAFEAGWMGITIVVYGNSKESQEFFANVASSYQSIYEESISVKFFRA